MDKKGEVMNDKLEWMKQLHKELKQEWKQSKSKQSFYVWLLDRCDQDIKYYQAFSS